MNIIFKKTMNGMLKPIPFLFVVALGVLLACGGADKSSDADVAENTATFTVKGLVNYDDGITEGEFNNQYPVQITTKKDTVIYYKMTLTGQSGTALETMTGSGTTDADGVYKPRIQWKTASWGTSFACGDSLTVHIVFYKDAGMAEEAGSVKKTATTICSGGGDGGGGDDSSGGGGDDDSSGGGGVGNSLSDNTVCGLASEAEQGTEISFKVNGVDTTAHAYLVKLDNVSSTTCEAYCGNKGGIGFDTLNNDGVESSALAYIFRNKFFPGCTSGIGTYSPPGGTFAFATDEAFKARGGVFERWSNIGEYYGGFSQSTASPSTMPGSIGCACRN